MFYRYEKNENGVDQYAKINNIFLYPYNPENGYKPILVSCKYGFLLIEKELVENFYVEKKNKNKKAIKFSKFNEPFKDVSDIDKFSENLLDAYNKWNKKIYSNLKLKEPNRTSRMVSAIVGGFSTSLFLCGIAGLFLYALNLNLLAIFPMFAAVFPTSTYFSYENLFTNLTQKKKDIWIEAYENSLEENHGYNEHFIKFCNQKENLAIYDIEEGRENNSAVPIEDQNFINVASKLSKRIYTLKTKIPNKIIPIEKIQNTKENKDVSKSLQLETKKKSIKSKNLSQKNLFEQQKIEIKIDDETIEKNREIVLVKENEPEESKKRSREKIRCKMEDDFKSINHSRTVLSKRFWYTDPLMINLDKIQGIAKDIIGYLNNNQKKLNSAVKFVSVYQSKTDRFLKRFVDILNSNIGSDKKSKAKKDVTDYLEQSSILYKQEFDNIITTEEPENENFEDFNKEITRTVEEIKKQVNYSHLP